MLKNSTKESAACKAWMETSVPPSIPINAAKLAWHAACLWQRNQDAQLVKDVLCEGSDMEEVILTILDQERG